MWLEFFEGTDRRNLQRLRVEFRASQFIWVLPGLHILQHLDQWQYIHSMSKLLFIDDFDIIMGDGLK